MRDSHEDNRETVVGTNMRRIENGSRIRFAAAPRVKREQCANITATWRRYAPEGAREMAIRAAIERGGSLLPGPSAPSVDGPTLGA